MSTKKLELGNLLPIREVISAYRELEQAATKTHGENDLVAATWRDARLRLQKALDEAENPHLAEGLSVEEYAAREGIKINSAYKRIQRNKVPAKYVPGRGLIVQLAS